MRKYIEVKGLKPTIETTETTLLSGRDTGLDVGSWVKFTQVGKIVEATRQIGSTGLRVKVEIKSDSYSIDPVNPETQDAYECVRCGKQFEYDWKAERHFDDEHPPKPRAKRKEKAK